MGTFLTPNRHGYSVRFSPFNPKYLAVSTSQSYGFAGGGTLYFLELKSNGNGLCQRTSFEWTDGLFDLVWSESNSSIVVTASGDGSLQMWSIIDNPGLLETFSEHKNEVYSLDWSKTRQEQLILSSSWDCSIKLWDPNKKSSLSTFLGHTELVYNAIWSPLIPNCFASVSGDGTLKIWNSLNSNFPNFTIKVHDAEVLSCDWCKYDQNILASGGSDGLIRVWDLRNASQPLVQLKSGNYAVRRLQFSPHSFSILASVNYDFTTRIWNFKEKTDATDVVRHHSEFVYGLDWNVHVEGEIADCGWDSLVHVFTPTSLRR